MHTLKKDLFKAKYFYARFLIYTKKRKCGVKKYAKMIYF